MIGLNVKNCVSILLFLLLKMCLLESRPAPSIGALLDSLFGGLFQTQPAQPYAPQYPNMLNLQQPVPAYRNQPMPAIFAPNTFQPQYTNPFYPTTGVQGAATTLAGGLVNFINGMLGSITSIFNGVFGDQIPNYPWVPL